MPLRHLSTVETPDGHKLSLHERDGDFFVSIDGLELMSTRAHDSETALARRALEELRARRGPRRVLIGGLGLGFTLRAALERVGGDGHVAVAELFPTVVEWHREHLGEIGRTIEDTRVHVLERDVHDLVSPAAGPWHAILLDVDNGPDSPCVDSNARLYTDRGIERTREALVEGGVLAVWSTDRDPDYTKRLRKAGLDAWSETVHAHGGRGSKHTLFFARRPAGPKPGSHRRQRRRVPGRS